jgi:hypothetical protein
VQPKFPYCDSKPTGRSCKVELAIIQFTDKEFNEFKSNSKATYWHLEHKPLVLMEFKVRTGNDFLREAKRDLDRLSGLQKRYTAIKHVYFCFISDILPSDERMKTRIEKSVAEL